MILAVLASVMLLCPMFITDDSEASTDIVVNDLTISLEIIDAPTATAHGTVRTVNSSVSSTVAAPLKIDPTVEIGSKLYDVVEIGDNSFKNWKITSITLPETVKIIGASAFQGCYDVKEIHINSTPEMKENCFCLGDSTHKASCSMYGFVPTRDVGFDGNPYKDIFGDYTDVKYLDIEPERKVMIYHLIIIVLGMGFLLFMGKTVKPKKIKRPKVKKTKGKKKE